MIKIIVDSGSDYLPEEIAERRIDVVPLQVSFGSRNYLDGRTLTREAFFGMLLEEEEFPVTSQPSPAAFLEFFAEAKACGDTVICIMISSALSGTFQSALTAKQMAEYEEIYLVDSLCASFGIQYLCDRACAMRDEKKNAAEIVTELEKLKERIRVYFMADTLEYLYRGGRLSRSGLLAGRLINMKPLLTLSRDGKVRVSDCCLGMHRAYETVVRHLKKEPPDEAFPLYTLFSVRTENTEKLEEKLYQDQIAFHDRKQIGGVIGAHIGPGASGVFYVAKEMGGE